MIVTTVRVENLEALPPNPITVAAKTSTDVLLDKRTTPSIAYRFIQNLTGAEIYYAFNADCKADIGQKVYHGTLQDRQQLACPISGRVNVWSAAGGIVVPTELVKDML